MKSYLFIVSSTLLIIACNSAEKHRASVTKLSAGWDSANEKLVSFEATIADEVTHWQSMYDGMYVGEAAEAKLLPAVRAQADSLKAKCQGHGTTHRAIQQEVNVFIESWKKQASDVMEIEEGLKKRAISAEQIAKMEGLFRTVADANTKLAAWQKQMQATKDECFETCSQYANLVQESKSGGVTTAN